MALPYSWRLMQCVRRYYDGKVAYPHLVSGSKYLLVLLCFIFLELRDCFNNPAPVFLRVIMYIACTTFNSFWDSFYDFGLFHYVDSDSQKSKKVIFREKALFPNRATHVFIFITNILLRHLWILKITGNNIPHHAVMFLLVMGEGIRRFMWNLLRLENEQLSNCGLFRAVLEIPLPHESSNVNLFDRQIEEDKSSFMTTNFSINLSPTNENQSKNFSSYSSTIGSKMNDNSI